MAGLEDRFVAKSYEARVVELISKLQVASETLSGCEYLAKSLKWLPPKAKADILALVKKSSAPLNTVQYHLKRIT